MNSQSNLAFKRFAEPETESVGTEALNAQELSELLRLGSHRADVTVRASRARGARFVPVTFQDNHSTPFRPFRVY